MVVTTGKGLASQTPPLLLLEQGSGSPETPPSCHSQNLWICSPLLSLKGEARWPRRGGHASIPNTQVPRHRSALLYPATHSSSQIFTHIPQMSAESSSTATLSELVVQLGPVGQV